jgi:hypothetical protein
MTPAALAEYLQVIREAGCMSAILKGVDCDTESFELSVVLAPDISGPIGKIPEPGGWKSPNLDKEFEVEEHSV